MTPENPDQLALALEPEAASICCRKFDTMILEDSTTSAVRIPNGSKYIVLDCGGKIFELATYVVVDSKGLKKYRPILLE